MSTMDELTRRQLPVRLVMSPDVVGIVPEAPLEIALRMMVHAGVRHLPVIAHDRCLGLLHESDVLWRLWSTDERARPAVGMVARSPAPVVDLAASVGSAAQRMAAAGSDAVLVVDAGRIVGICTATNLVRLLASG